MKSDYREMYNLSVAEAHTYYVGEGQWLVHNTDCPLTLFHGTDMTSALNLLRGQKLDDAVATAMKNEGAAQNGFFLAGEFDVAARFANVSAGIRRDDAAVIQYQLTESARDVLFKAGAEWRDIQGVPGKELYIPPRAFAALNDLVASGGIRVTPPGR